MSQLDCQQSSLGCDSTAITRVSDSARTTKSTMMSDSIVDDVTQRTTDLSIDAIKASQLDWLPHSFLIYPNILRRLRNNEGVCYDEKNKESYVLVPFEQVDKFVPHDLYAQVQQDNQLFLAEKQVICNAFFKTTAFLLQQVVK